jgi:aldehyde dehydrogenase (NAD+)
MQTVEAFTEIRDDGLLINGRWRRGATYFERRNPARPQQLVGRSASATAADAADAYAAATAAAARWRATPAAERGTILRRGADLVQQRLELIARTLTAEEGKNPSVVLADADLERAATCIIRSAMLSTGQRCTATSRAIVVDDVYDDVVSALVDAASSLVVGDPLDESTDVGPLASQEQFNTVTGYLELAREHRLRVVAGGSASDPAEGYFVQPTIYADVDPSSAIAQEEIFGPVLAVIRATDADDAMRLANDTPYGLSGSIFTRDLRAALRRAHELEVGVVHLNGESAGAEPHVPFGGVKASSSGAREQGKSAREFFTEIKTIYIEDV